MTTVIDRPDVVRLTGGARGELGGTHSPDRAHRDEGLGVVLPAIAALVVGAVLGVISWRTGIPPGAAGLVLPTGVVAGLVVRQAWTIRDRARLARTLAVREEHYRSLLGASSDIIAVCDAGGTIT